MTQKTKQKAAFYAAFPHTIPIFTGFLFLGLAYGIYMHASGFSFVYPLLMSLTIYGGSLEFIAVSLLLHTFAPLQTFIIALMLQARHLFYGIAMLEKFRGTGWKKFYLIFGMCDESFSINYSAEVPEGIDRGWFMFFVTLLNQIYWVSGAALGGLLGPWIHFDLEGLDFVMTAMFVVIFLDHWLKEINHWGSLLGLGAAFVCLMIFGSDSFMIPTMLVVFLFVTGLRKTKQGQHIEQQEDLPS